MNENELTNPILVITNVHITIGLKTRLDLKAGLEVDPHEGVFSTTC